MNTAQAKTLTKPDSYRPGVPSPSDCLAMRKRAERALAQLAAVVRLLADSELTRVLAALVTAEDALTHTGPAGAHVAGPQFSARR